MKKKSFLMTIAMLCAVAQGAWAWSGNGTAASPYLIGNTKDWDTFVERTDLSSCEGEYFALNADITVTTMACASENHRFKGTFDGQGNTMTLDIHSTDGSYKVAPFRFAYGATFTKLVLTGTVEGEGQYVASLLGDTQGQTTIANCVSSAIVKGSSNYDKRHDNIGYNGGLVGNNGGGGTLTFTNCAFTGSLILNVDFDCYDAQIDPNSVGGFIGLTQDDTYAVFNHCVVDYENYTLTYGQVEGICKTFSCGNDANLTFNDCYYVKTLGNAQGTPCYKTTPAESLYGIITSAYGNHTYYYNVVATVPDVCLYTGEAIDPVTISKVDGTTLTKGTDYTVSITREGSDATEVKETGNYQLTVTGKGSYGGSQTFNLTVMKELQQGKGTPDDPYIIANIDDWGTFASTVNEGLLNDKCYKLADDWSSKTGYGSNAATALTSTIGTEEHPFSGTFDGKGQTLRVNINNTSENATAPFRYISGATIKDVTVTGTINGTIHASGLVGYAWAGTNTISGCTVSATVTVSTGGNQHMGGVVGHGKTSTVIIENTIFNGSLIHNKDYAGGLQGWSDGNKLTITNSFFLGNYNSGTVDDCFHPIALQDAGKTTTFTDQGAYYIYTTAPTMSATDRHLVTPGIKVTDEDINTPYSVNAPNGITYHYNVLTTEINNAADWNSFLESCLYSKTGFPGTYEGMTVNLNANITVTTWMNPEINRVFMGTFNGNGHTITLNYNTDKDCCAPFYMLKDATVKDLKISGTITTTGQYAAGFAFGTTDNCTFDNCVSNVTIASDAGYHGGFVARAGATTQSTLAFTKCAFTGSFSGNATHLSGFVADAEGIANSPLTVAFTNCMFYPSGFGNTSAAGCHTFAGIGANATLATDHCFYLDPLGEAQGKMASEIKEGEGLTINRSLPEESTVSHIAANERVPYIQYNGKLYAAVGDEQRIAMIIPGIGATDRVLNEISVTDTQGKEVETQGDLIWYKDISTDGLKDDVINMITFTMPASDVTIAPVFTDKPTGPYINLPRDNYYEVTPVEIAIPTCVTSFKLYDNGGKDGDYAEDCDGSITMHVPTGYALQLSGTITTAGPNGHDYLVVTTNTGQRLIPFPCSSSDGVETPIPTFFCTDESMTVRFFSDDSDNYAGLDLTVTLLNLSDTHNITIAEATGGTLSSTKEIAAYGESVPLTATPAEGYLLTDIIVTDAFGNVSNVTGGQMWYTTTPTDKATFTMPLTAVTVTPVFTNVFTAEGGLYARLPKSGSVTAQIPANVKSFKVYDDGGKDANYSDGITNRTVIKFRAPEGCTLQLKGSVTTEAGKDCLFVRDENEQVLLEEEITSPRSGERYDIPTVLSNGIDILFFSDEAVNYDGLDLTVTVVHSDWATANEGTEADPYLIETLGHLELLAHRVNGTGDETATDYADKFFRLQNDLSYTATTEWNNTESQENNFEAIGTSTHPFKGNFDGQGYAISGIRIYQPAAVHQGIFGDVVGGTVKNVILANARITGNSNTGGIVGFNENSTVNNCHAKSDVCIYALNASWLGGIVGYNYGGRGVSTVSNCTSRATIAVKNIGDYYGAIAGENYMSILSNCLAINAVVPTAKTSNRSGFIAGQSGDATLTNNYYTACTFNGEPNVTGKGCQGADVTANDGAVPVLRDNADNSTALSLLAANADVLGRYSVALDGRTLYKDGSWNTLCLPFDVTNLASTLLQGAVVMTLSASSFADGTLTMNFSDAYSIEAGKPYIVKWASGGENLASPVFAGVTIAAVPSASPSGNTAADPAYVGFIGSFSPVTLVANDRSVLYLGDGDNLYWPTDKVTVGSCRAYFRLLNGLQAGTTGGVRAFALDFGDGEETSVSEEFFAEQSGKAERRVKSEESAGAWYDLQGRRLSGKPTTPGLYINNGIKVAIKH